MWKGQQPFQLRPFLDRRTLRPTTEASGVRARSSSRKAGGRAIRGVKVVRLAGHGQPGAVTEDTGVAAVLCLVEAVPMGAIQLPERIERLIEEKIAEGRAPDAASLVEEALLRLFEGDARYDDELARVIEEGEADFAAGRYVTLETPEDFQRFGDDLITRVRQGLLTEHR